MKYSDNINLRMVAYCHDVGYVTNEERWEKDCHSNHHFVEWLRKQRDQFLKDQGVEFKPDPNWGDMERKIYMSRHSNEFDLWLKAMYPDKMDENG